MIRNPMIWLLAPLALAACATPREACIRDAQSDLRSVTREIAETETVLARGYRVIRTRETELALTTCLRRTRDGETVGFPCQRPIVVTDETPIGIDYSEERARLARLRAAQARLVEDAELGIRQCRAQFPAEG